MHVNQPSERVPVWQNVKTAYAIVFSNLIPIIRFSWPYIIILAVLHFLHGYLFWETAPLPGNLQRSGSSWGADKVITFQAAGIVVSFIAAPLVALLAIAFHRFIILDEPIGIRLNDKSDWRRLCLFVALWLALLLLMQIPNFLNYISAADPSTSFVSILATILTLLFAAVNVRLMIAFPAIAVNDPRATLETTWMLTKGNTLRLIWATFLITLPIMIVYLVVLYTLGLSERLEYALFLGAAEILFLMPLYFILAAFASLAYLHFYANRRPDTNPGQADGTGA